MASIALVEPEPPSLNFWSAARLPRLGLASIGAVLKRAGHKVQIFCQTVRRARQDELLAADVIGISTTTSTAPAAYRLADWLRAAGKPVMLGGVHATFCTDEALQHANCVVRGEAEEIMPALVERIAARAPVDDIRGVFTEPGKAPAGVPAECRVADLDTLPFPDLSLIQGWRPDRLRPVVTSRGCPRNCTFCSVAPMFGRRCRFRSPASVLDELARVTAPAVVFYDDNFVASRQRTVALLEGMLSRGILPRWSAQVRAEVAQDRELVKLFRRARCKRVYVGYESVSDATLAEYGKAQTVDELIDCSRVFREHGIGVHGMFVLGGESDDVGTVRRTSWFACKHRLDSAQFLILTPLPGTQVHRELLGAGRILESDWSLYDGHHVVYRPLRLAAAALQRETWKAQRRFYSVWEAAKSFARLRWKDGARKVLGWGMMLQCEAGARRFVRHLRQREAALRPPAA